MKLLPTLLVTAFGVPECGSASDADLLETSSSLIGMLLLVDSIWSGSCSCLAGASASFGSTNVVVQLVVPILRMADLQRFTDNEL